MATGSGGFLAADLGLALPLGVPSFDVIAGLGGRPVTQASLKRCIHEAVLGRLEPLSFLDLRSDMLEEVLP